MNLHSKFKEVLLLRISRISIADPFVTISWPKGRNATCNSSLYRETYLVLHPSFINVSSKKGSGQSVCILEQQAIHTTSERVEHCLVDLAYRPRCFTSQMHPCACLR